ncbi:type VII secretion protein EccB [Nocardioides sp.]|uniref:type VII secretion protein EccB n=1 Tax=Nocardioides sp. TaxID=35761 RepID=UPI003784A714
MATKKDLVEAYSFNRRRLVTAFVSGAPGGREVEPARPGRTIVGGVALAVLLAAGAAIAGVFAPRTPEDWDQPGLVISKETGAAYVILDSGQGELRPVINTTSAKLILGDDAEPTLISQDTIDDQQIGDDIGIFGAPASVPTASLLIGSGWTACTGDQRGIRVRVTPAPDVDVAAGSGVTVVNDGHYYVVARSDPSGPGAGGSYVYPVPPQTAPGVDQTDNLLQQVGLPPTGSAVRVPRAWLELFPVAAPLDWSAFDLDGFGQRPPEALTGDAARARIGDVLETDDGTYLLVTRTGPVQLSDFAAQVYLDVVRPDGTVARPLRVSAPPSVRRGDDSFLTDTRWPAVRPEPLGADPCARLTAERGEAPTAELAAPGDASAAGSLPADRIDPVVDPGRGALVLSGGWSGSTAGAAPYLVDAKGRADPLAGADAAALLGYADVPAPVVPDSWVELFRCGVTLSQEASLQPPTEPTGPSCG